MPLHPPESGERALRDYLGRVRSHLPVRDAPEILRELESSILDRVDGAADRTGREPDARLLREVLSEIGEPEAVADRYAPQRHLVEPRHHRYFLVCTTLTFAVHVALIGLAAAVAHPLHAGPFAVAPPGPHGLVSLLASLVHAFLLDVGLNVAVFALVPWARRILPAMPASFRVDAAPRAAGARAVLATLVALVVLVFRDDVFVVVVEGRSHPLFSPWFSIVAPLVGGVLAFAVVVDLAYALVGERRATVALDALHGVATLSVMLHLLAGDPVLEIPPVSGLLAIREPVNGFLADLGTLVLAVAAGLAAVKTVRRLVRVAQV